MASAGWSSDTFAKFYKKPIIDQDNVELNRRHEILSFINNPIRANGSKLYYTHSHICIFIA